MNKEKKSLTLYLLTSIDKTFPIRIVILVIAIFIMTFGVALCIRANLGSSPISVLPYTWSLAGGMRIGNFQIPELSMGTYTFIMNAIFVFLQIILLRRKYHPIQLLQLALGFFFGYFLDLNMMLTIHFEWTNLILCIIQLLIGGAAMALGISLEIITHLIMMPGDGIALAITRLTNADFGKIKVIFDCSMGLLGIISMLIFFGSWQWQIIGIGTIIAMFYVGIVVRIMHPIATKLEGIIMGPQA